MTRLYKFVGSLSAVRAMAGGSLKFARTDELNDPSELVPLMNRKAVSTSLAAIREHGYTAKQFEWLGYQEAILRLLSPETRILSRPATVEIANRIVKNSLYDDLDLMEQQLLATISLIRSRVGILSLTERFDSLPMWAHYAAQARGYVVCFDELDREFQGDSTGSLTSLNAVRYVDDLVGMTHDPSTQNDLFFCKFKDWSYEREWRVVSALSACELSTDGKLYLRSIGLPHISGVICGWNVSTEEVRALSIDMRNINKDVKVYTTSLIQGRVALSSPIDF